MFGTEYLEDQEFEQLRNEHYEKFGKVITDSIIKIGGHIYHIECQSEKDGSMAVRMMEYDFAIAIERSSLSGDDITEIDFPESCVLYIRNHKDMPNYHEVRVRFSDGQSVLYRVPVIMAKDYTVNSIFEKRLLLLLPYHILRYEHFLKSNGASQKKMEGLLNDYREINSRLLNMQDRDGREPLYVDLMELIGRIADYVIPGDNPSRERLGEIMGGQILELRSERLREEGREKGREEGREKGREEGRQEGREEGRTLEIYSMVQDGDTSPERGAKRLGITVPVLKKRMTASGYRYPQV